MSLADLYKKGELKIGDDVIDTTKNEIVTISNIGVIKGNGIAYNIGNERFGSQYGSKNERFGLYRSKNESLYGSKNERFIGEKKIIGGGEKI